MKKIKKSKKRGWTIEVDDKVIKYFIDAVAVVMFLLWIAGIGDFFIALSLGLLAFVFSFGEDFDEDNDSAKADKKDKKTKAKTVREK